MKSNIICQTKSGVLQRLVVSNEQANIHTADSGCNQTNSNASSYPSAFEYNKHSSWFSGAKEIILLEWRHSCHPRMLFKEELKLNFKIHIFILKCLLSQHITPKLWNIEFRTFCWMHIIPYSIFFLTFMYNLVCNTCNNTLNSVYKNVFCTEVQLQPVLWSIWWKQKQKMLCDIWSKNASSVMISICRSAPGFDLIW